MEVNLIHNGYNVERRKLYPTNPRNNLTSTVDLIWPKSLEKQQRYPCNFPKVKKQEELHAVTQNYTKAIEKVMENQHRIDKSSFRVMPNHPTQINLKVSRMADSLSHQLKTFKDNTNYQSINEDNRYQTQAIRNQVIQQSKCKPVQNSSNVSSTVFGYNINYQTFKRQSYMSKLLSDRLEPYLSKTVDVKAPRYSSFQMSNPLPNYFA